MSPQKYDHDISHNLQISQDNVSAARMVEAKFSANRSEKERESLMRWIRERRRARGAWVRKFHTLNKKEQQELGVSEFSKQGLSNCNNPTNPFC